MLLPLQGVLLFSIRTPQGAALGYVLIGLSARIIEFWHPLLRTLLQLQEKPPHFRYKTLTNPRANPSHFQKGSFCIAKRVLLRCKRSPFGEQNESFWKAKGVLFKNRTWRFTSSDCKPQYKTVAEKWTCHLQYYRSSSFCVEAII